MTCTACSRGRRRSKCAASELWSKKFFERLLHSLVHRIELPVHGEREAEQAARIPALPQDVLAVQVESGQSSASQEKDGQPQSAGDPVRHQL